MCKHEEKNCAHCKTIFECKVGDISHCQCYDVKLSGDEMDFIARRYTDCLCAPCMQAMKREFHLLQRELQLKIFFTGR